MAIYILDSTFRASSQLGNLNERLTLARVYIEKGLKMAGYFEKGWLLNRVLSCHFYFFKIRRL